jgi:putative transposase
LKGNEKRKVEREVSEIIDKAIAERFLNTQRLPVRAVYDMVVLRIEQENNLRTKAGIVEKLDCPCEKTIYNVVAKIDPYEVAKARYGKRYADFKFRPKKEGPRPTRPLQRVEIDHTKLDLLVVDMERRMPIGRPWLTLAIDVYSKSIAGIYIGFIPPSYQSVMQCLKHAMSPKTYLKDQYPNIKHTWDAYGIMETVVVDNGKEFHSKDLEDACLQLGIVIQYAPVKCPWYKTSVERFFGTLNTSLLHQQPGTTFSNIFQKDEYDSMKNAVISLEAFKEMAHKWIVDIYHQDKHKGLVSIPAVVWETGVKEYPPALPSSSGELDIMLGMIKTRILTDKGIELYNLIYNDDNLMSLRRRYKVGSKEIVKVKIDPDDLSMIWVQDKFRKNYIPVRAISQSYSQGLNLMAHRIICRYAREQLKLNLDIASLALAKEEIWMIASREWNLTKRTGSRQRLAQFLNVGRDDYGQIIEQQDLSDIPDTSDQSLISASDPVLPSPAEHPGNGVSSIGTVMNSTGEGSTVDSGNGNQTQSDATADAEIGMGDFVTDKPRKGRKKSKKVVAACENGNGSTEKQCKPLTTISVTDKAPDLSGWSVGRMSK